MSNFRNIYNFDSLISLLQQIKDETDNIQCYNMNLDAFFKKIAQDEQQNAQLEIKAKLLNSKIQKSLDIIGKKPFEKFREFIPFKKLTECFNPSSSWSWDPSKKSQTLTLNENDMLVRNETVNDSNYYAVLGSLEMKEGRHKWGIEILNINNDNQWISFGLIETQHINNLEIFPWKKGIGMTAANFRINMVGDQKLHDYKNKFLICDLNLDDGTFQISFNNIVIAREQNNLKSKTLVPYISLYHNGNCARLHIL